MCSPELTKGMCQICTGTLTPDTIHVDRHGNVWDIHKGVCTMLAGEVSMVYAVAYSQYMERIRKASSQEVRRVIVNAFHKWVRQVADENHYYDGP